MKNKWTTLTAHHCRSKEKLLACRPDCQKAFKKRALSNNLHPGVNGGVKIMIFDWSFVLPSDWILVF